MLQWRIQVVGAICSEAWQRITKKKRPDYVDLLRSLFWVLLVAVLFVIHALTH